MHKNSILATWVTGYYTGENAKNISAIANAGGSYIVLENSGARQSPVVMVAFRMVVTEPLPENVVEVTDPYKISDYEKIRKRTQGIQTGLKKEGI